jgi:WD40 repeat protein
VVLWNISDGRELRRFVGHSDGVRALSFSPDGDRLLSGGWDYTARLWDIVSGDEIQRFDGHASHVTAVAFLPGEDRVITASGDSTVVVWDLADGDALGTFKHPAWVNDMAVARDGRLFLAAAGDGALLRDVESGEVTRVLGPHDGRVEAVALSDDGQRALTGDAGGIVRLWDLGSGREIERLPGHEARVNWVGFSPGDSLIVSAGPGQTIRVWDAIEGRELDPPTGYRVTFSRASGALFVASQDGLALWDAASGATIYRFPAAVDPVGPVSLAPDGQSLAVSGGDGSVRIWEFRQGSETRRLSGVPGWLPISFSPDGRYLVTADQAGTVTFWDPATWQEAGRFSAENAINDATFSPDGRLLLTVEADYVVRIREVPSGDLIQSLAGHEDDVLSARFSPDGTRILTTSSDGAAGIWSTQTGRPRMGFLQHVDEATGAYGVQDGVFTPDGLGALTIGVDGIARLWDPDTGQELLTFEKHERPAAAVAISPDGREVMTGGADRTVRLWDSESGDSIRVLEGHREMILDVAFGMDRRFLFSTSLDGTVRVWDRATGRPAATLMSFRDGEWAVVDPEGRFDAANGGDIDGMHWAVGLETIELNQLKERYYEPGLLAKILGFNDEPLRPVEAFAELEMHPETEVEMDGARLRIRLVNRGGGIGRVVVSVNGKEVSADAREPDSDPNASSLDLMLDLTGHPYFQPGEDNEIEVRAFNALGYLASRGTKVSRRVTGEPIPDPSLWALVVGVSDYAGEMIDLRYAEKDAVDMARALELGAANLFGAQRAQVRLLTTAEGVPGALPPTKENLERALEEIGAEASSNDILIVYLAGHGVTHGGPEGDFYYLTAEASSGNLEDPAVRRQRAISSEELTQLIQGVAATKQVLILDTCGAGRVVEQLTEDRDVSSSQKRALERLKDRMGLFVLAGSAADAVSYEASRFGQGLLTYSLLLGMRGAALREEQFVDVGTLFAHSVDQVPTLAAEIGGIQEPLLATPRGGRSFDIGQLAEEDRSRIPVATPKPFVLRAVFQDEVRLVDHLRLAARVNEALRTASARGSEARFVFVDAADLPGAYTLAGRYEVTGTAISVTVVLSRTDIEPTRFEVNGEIDDLEGLVSAIVEEVEVRIGLSSSG